MCYCDFSKTKLLKFFGTNRNDVGQIPLTMNKITNCAKFCRIFKTVCPICCEFAQSSVSCVQSAMSKNFLLSDQICFVQTHGVPRLPFSGALLPLTPPPFYCERLKFLFCNIFLDYRGCLVCGETDFVKFLVEFDQKPKRKKD